MKGREKVEAGSYVIFASGGVCRYEGICYRSVGDSRRPYFVLRPLADESASFWIPAHSGEPGTKITELVSRDEIIAIINQLPLVRIPWIPETKDRSENYKRILAGCDRVMLLAMIESINEKKAELMHKRKKLWAVDATALAAAEALIYTEFSIVLDISPEEVPGFIRTTLQFAPPAG